MKEFEGKAPLNKHISASHSQKLTDFFSGVFVADIKDSAKIEEILKDYKKIIEVYDENDSETSSEI